MMRLGTVIDLTLYKNSRMSITLTKNTESQYCIKYIDVQHHYINKLVNKKELTIEYIPGSRMLLDRMTKVLLTEYKKRLTSQCVASL